MKEQESACAELTGEDFRKIRQRAVERRYRRGELIFSEGDEADYIYFIESGEISIFIQKFATREEISVLGAGDYFGEMAVFYKDRRSASVMALTDATLLGVDKSAFLKLIGADRQIGAKINAILARRNEELVLKERLLDTTGVKGKNLRISIKGDPSLRESAFIRGRYDSPVDRVLPQLEPRLQELLVDRCVYELFIHFNSGEVRIGSVFDPFKEHIHPADKLVDDGYIERHFPALPFDEKTAMVRRLYGAIASDPCFLRLPHGHQKLYRGDYQGWEPLGREEIAKALSRLSALRTIPDFYLRNFGISMTRDAVRMQFNCDGTHIVSTEDYERFLRENIDGAA